MPRHAEDRLEESPFEDVAGDFSCTSSASTSGGLVCIPSSAMHVLQHLAITHLPNRLRRLDARCVGRGGKHRCSCELRLVKIQLLRNEFPGANEVYSFCKNTLLCCRSMALVVPVVHEHCATRRCDVTVSRRSGGELWLIGFTHDREPAGFATRDVNAEANRKNGEI